MLERLERSGGTWHDLPRHDEFDFRVALLKAVIRPILCLRAKFDFWSATRSKETAHSSRAAVHFPPVGHGNRHGLARGVRH